MLDLPDIRKSFEFLSDCTYLNTASVGLSWAGLGAAVAEFYEGAQACGITARDQWSAKQEDTKVRLGSLVGVPDSRIHFVGSTTEALNLVALGMPLRRGDRVAVAADEFPSVIQPWLSRAAHGIELVRVPIPCEAERSQALAAALTGNVRALAVSHVHWQTGTRVDLRLLSGAACRADCRLIVDGVQAVAATPVDAGLADAYCASTFKWLLSGFGLGFLTMSERLASEWTPPLRGYSNLMPSRNPQYGHANYPGIYALNASLQYFESMGWDAIHRRVSCLSARLHNSLSSRGFEILTPADARAGIVSVRRENAQAIVRALAAEAIFVEDRDEIVRASPHFYNTDDDIDRFVSSLAQHA
jgi:selenocysteine lyase/cysteine desulfurase